MNLNPIFAISPLNIENGGKELFIKIFIQNIV